jgi:hypothetical protein
MAELISLNRDPKLNEFSKEDFVLNTITGDLFAKTSDKLFKVASRNTNTGLSTDDVLKLIPPSSDKNTILTDILEYKEIGINKNNSGSFLTEFIAPAIIGGTTVGRTYYNLDLSKIQAMFIRLDDEFLFPIGTITPPTINGRAHTVYFESGPSDDGGHFFAKPSVAGVVRTEILVDTGDLLRESFTTRTVGGVEYPDTLKINTGCRAMLVRSRFDWKIQSLSDFSEVTASFTTLNATNINSNIDGGSF